VVAALDLKLALDLLALGRLDRLRRVPAQTPPAIPEAEVDAAAATVEARVALDRDVRAHLEHLAQ
jgi:hypothetical protein